MKKSTFILLALILITFVINGCQKSELASVPKNKLAASNLNATFDSLILTVSNPRVSQNYPDTIRISGTTPADSVHWFVTPNANLKPVQKTSSRYILAFTAPGTYKIKAVVNGTDSVSTSLVVTDSVYAAPTYILTPITGNIKLTPHFHKGNSADSTYLYFTAQTTNISPCANSYLQSGSFLTSDKNFIITFDGVESPDGSHCSAGGSTLSSTISFNGYHQNYVADTASYPLKPRGRSRARPDSR